MSQAIDTYTAAVNASYDAIDEAVGSLETSLAGVSDDAAFLKQTIDFLQNNPGPISAEDQAKLDAAQLRANGLVARFGGVKTALAALDDATERPATPPPESP